jgi:hypothetical protein
LVGTETEKYIKLGLEHLLETSSYALLIKQDTHQDTLTLKTKIYDWTLCHRAALMDDEANFIHHQLEKTQKNPHGYFYLLIKLCKEKISSYPIFLDCGSLPHSLE